MVSLADMVILMSNFDDFAIDQRKLSLVNCFSSLDTKMILKIQNETFLRITRYFQNHLECVDSNFNDVYVWNMNPFQLSMDMSPFGIKHEGEGVGVCV